MVQQKVGEPVFVKAHQPMHVGCAASRVGNDKDGMIDLYFPVAGIKDFIEQTQKNC